MKKHVQLGYVLGSSSVLAAIVYFYAANWGALSRWEKFLPIVLLIIGLYGLSAWLARRPGREFLSRLALFSCCVCFGVGAALVGQTYNAHADSYSLFAIWLLPALLFAILTRWQPFYVLSYVLGSLAYLYFFFPESGRFVHSEPLTIGILLALTALNGALFALTERKLLLSPVLQLISFCAVLGLLLYLSISFTFEQYGWMLNAPLAILTAAAIWRFHSAKNKMYLLLAGLWVSVIVIVKYSELAIHYFNEAFLLINMVFIVAFIAANVWFLRYIRSLSAAPGSEAADASGEADAAAQAAQDEDKARAVYIKWATRILTAAVIAIGTFIGTTTLVGSLILIAGIEEPQHILVFFGIAAVGAMIAARGLNSVVRYTLLTAGMLVGVGSAIVMESLPLLLLFIALAVLGFCFIQGTVQRVYFAITGEIVAGIALHQSIRGDGVLELTVLCALLAVICALAGFAVQSERIKQPLLYSSYPAFLTVFFILTFIMESAAYYICNALFFLTVTAALAIARKRETSWIYSVSLYFWIAYLVYKYYDTAWKLLHKSVSLALIGVLLIVLTVWLEKRAGRELAPPRAASRTRVWLLAAAAALQLVLLAAQVGRSELLLANGQLIKLELVPLDPRSLLQGDYVQLRYAISEPELPAATLETLNFRSKAAAVLAPNKDGIYQFKRLYEPGEALGPGEVRINGRWDGYMSFQYGIESYFVPEGTGLEVERNAKFAEVRVSAGGDAILVRLTSS